MIIRNFVWNLDLWKNVRLKKWLNDFKPEAVVLQVGDCEFMLRFALWVKKVQCADVLVYIGNILFKKYNYFNDGHDKLYNFLYRVIKKTFNKLYSIVKGSVFCVIL